jgi:hypothetical protein
MALPDLATAQHEVCARRVSGILFVPLAGFAWPPEAIPQTVRIASLVVPSSSAIDGFVTISQLGAPMFDARRDFLILWTLAIAYAASRWHSSSGIAGYCGQTLQQRDAWIAPGARQV